MGSRVTHEPAEALYWYGVAREDFALSQMTPETEFGSLPFRQLAEARAAQGEFEDAAGLVLAGPEQEDYTAKAAAVASIGTKLCDCNETVLVRQPGNAKGVVHHNSRPIAEFLRYGTDRIQITKCDNCGIISAK